MQIYFWYMFIAHVACFLKIILNTVSFQWCEQLVSSVFCFGGAPARFCVSDVAVVMILRMSCSEVLTNTMQIHQTHVLVLHCLESGFCKQLRFLHFDQLTM